MAALASCSASPGRSSALPNLRLPAPAAALLRLSIHHEEWAANCKLPPGPLELLLHGAALQELSFYMSDDLSNEHDSLPPSKLAEGIGCGAWQAFFLLL